MNYLTQLLPAAVIVSVIVVVLLSELLKRLDKKNFLKGYRVLFPAFLSLGMSALLDIGTFIGVGQLWFYWAVIFALSVFLYELVLRKIQETMKE